jgi:hypothetical protein
MNEVTFKPCPTKPDPLALAGVIHLELTPEQSAQLEAAGDCLIAIARGSYPHRAGRLVISVLPVSMATATACCNVATGSHRATRIRPKL